MQKFFAHGKLLLTGEYVVLDGAVAIGMPTKLGQHLEIESLDKKQPIGWEAFLHNGEPWFYAKINPEDFSVIETNHQEAGNNIADILGKVSNLNPIIFQTSSYHFKTKLDFPKDWGLGSSSTLIALLSKFADIDAFKLSKATFGGSGYDISCAILPKIQTYQLTKKDRKVSFIKLHPKITSHVYFIHLNQKQNSRDGIALYRSLEKNKRLIKSISDLSKEIISCDNLEEFEDLLYVHERLLSEFLDIPTIHEKIFPAYNEGIVKSLGAWGGDFVMVTSRSDNLSYFEQLGYKTIIPYHELIVEG